MKVIQDLNLQEVTQLVVGLGQPGYRAVQIFDAMYDGKTLSESSNIPKELSGKIQAEFITRPISIHTRLEDDEGTQKFVFSLSDGNLIEGVLMKYKYGNTLCVSTQVGCRMGCKFCASTLGGLIRNLSAGEILAQILTVNRLLGGTAKKRQITNVVLMGSGEPLDNFENVAKFLQLVTSPDGINISARNISLSTCGLVSEIKKLSTLGLPIILTISLHAPNDTLRQKLMPIAKRFKISEIIAAAKGYFQATGRRVVFEYALIDGENNTRQCAVELAGLLRGFPSHLNLIPLNEVKESRLKTVSRKSANEFASILKDLGVSVTVRRTIGETIDGACGQLRAKIAGDLGAADSDEKFPDGDCRQLKSSTANKNSPDSACGELKNNITDETSPSLRTSTAGKNSPALETSTVGKNSPALETSTAGKTSPALEISTSGKNSPALETSTANKNSPSFRRGGDAGDGVVQKHKDLPFNKSLRENAKALRKAGNLSEVLLWVQLKKKQLCGLDFDRQKIIGNYIVDFYCPSRKTVIEIDGDTHNEKAEYDTQRDDYLKSLGLEVIHILDADIKNNMEEVLLFLKDYFT